MPRSPSIGGSATELLLLLSVAAAGASKNKIQPQPRTPADVHNDSCEKLSLSLSLSRSPRQRPDRSETERGGFIFSHSQAMRSLCRAAHHSEPPGDWPFRLAGPSRGLCAFSHPVLAEERLGRRSTECSSVISTLPQ